MVTISAMETLTAALEDAADASGHEQSLCHVSASDLFPKRGLQETSLPEENTSDLEPVSEPFVPVFGESIEYISRCNSGGVLALSNYRLFLKREESTYNIPIVLIEQVEVRDLFFLHILCKDAQSVRCTFNTGEACTEWQRRILRAAMPPRDIESVFALAFLAWANEDADEDNWVQLGGRSEGPTSPALVGSVEASDQNFRKEVERLGFDTAGAWRVTLLNAEYGLCPSYPRLILLPACINDEVLEEVGKFRSARRVPAVVWRHTGNGAVLVRCSQPEVGWLGWRSHDDEDLIRAIADACACDAGTDSNVGDEDGLTGEGQAPELADEPQKHPKAKRVLIVDARSYTTAVANRARGGGCECPEYYPRCDISFMNLANIHAVRKSSQALRSLLASDSTDQPNWFSQLEGSRWFQLMAGLLRAAVAVAAALEREARPVVVHCSDGWDRTPQIVGLAQLMLDPHYRTIEGFQTLVEREWLDFGHKFGDRCGLGAGSSEDANERSPVFLQWLDCVHQLMHQFPTAFQFNHAYLVRLAQHTYSSLFGTFMCNSQQERSKQKVPERTLSVWKFLAANPACHNLLFAANQQVLWPSCSVRDLRLWSEVYLGGQSRSHSSISVTREETSSSSCPPSVTPSSSATPSPATPGGSSEGGGTAPLSKTRSCEDISSTVVDGVQCHARRSSHPSLTESHLESLLNGITNETESVFVNGHCELSVDSNMEDFADAFVPPSPTKSNNNDNNNATCQQDINSEQHQQATLIFPSSVPTSSSIPPPPPLPPPNIQSIESSTDTLVATEALSQIPPESCVSNNGLVNGKEERSVTVQQIIENNQQLPTCHVCASSRRFLLESSVLEFCSTTAPAAISSAANNNTTSMTQTRTNSHYSTPTSYPATPGSDCCTTEEDSPLRPGRGPPILPFPQQIGKLEIDGLATLHCDVQARLRQMQADYQSQIEALQRELHTTRLALIQQVCHHCGPPHVNGDHRTDETGSLPESVDSIAEGHHAGQGGPVGQGGSNSRSASEVSWETVEEKDALPTLWVPDHAVRRCMGCDTEFWLGRRKHHCRSCGRIFCADCSWNTAPLPSEQLYEPVRVCASCYRQISCSPIQITNGMPLTGLSNGVASAGSMSMISTTSTVTATSSSLMSSSSPPQLLSSQQACKQPSPHEKLHKPIVSTAST